MYRICIISRAGTSNQTNINVAGTLSQTISQHIRNNKPNINRVGTSTKPNINRVGTSIKSNIHRIGISMEEMERPRGLKMIYDAGGDPLCTSHHCFILHTIYSYIYYIIHFFKVCEE